MPIFLLPPPPPVFVSYFFYEPHSFLLVPLALGINNVSVRSHQDGDSILENIVTPAVKAVIVIFLEQFCPRGKEVNAVLKFAKSLSNM